MVKKEFRSHQKKTYIKKIRKTQRVEKSYRKKNSKRIQLNWAKNKN